MIYITGDTHGQFGRIKAFCDRIGTSKDDILIILGDVGINYYGNPADRRQKKFLESLPITIFAIHGNHEKWPHTIPAYHETAWHDEKYMWKMTIRIFSLPKTAKSMSLPENGRSSSAAHTA